MELMLCFGLVAGATLQESTNAVVDVRRMMLDLQEPKRLMLSCANKPLFAICISHLYPTMHPRYAPVTALVITRQVDVAAMQHHPARAKIHQAMFREHGFVYDADELMLPLPKIK